MYRVLYVCVSDCSDNWYRFTAYSNVLWIHYLIDKLLKAKTYTLADKARQHSTLHRQLRSVHRELLDYDSAIQLVNSCDFFL